jgi:hypothetical protein
MQKPSILRCALILAVVVVAAAPLHSEEKPEGEAAMNAEMAKWMELAVVGEHHTALADYEGTWNVSGKTWMDGEQPPMDSKGTSVNRLVLGGRFLESRYDSEFMDTPFQGIGISGFDNFKKKHISFWIDSMGTMMAFTEGTCEGHCAVVTEHGEWPNVTGDGVKPYRMVTRRVGRDEYRVEMFEPGPDGKELKRMELVFTRAGGSSQTR